jgi:hypothetical protein
MDLTTLYWNVVDFVFGIIFATIWGGVAIALFGRYDRLAREYLARFPDEIQFSPRNPDLPRSFASYAAIWRVQLREQPDPELEEMRREIWRRYRLYMIWIFAFPIPVFTVVAILTSMGYVH